MKVVDPRVSYETLWLRCMVLGPEGANDRRQIRQLARSHLWLETRNLLRSYGFTEAEIAMLMGTHRSHARVEKFSWREK